MIDFKIYIAKEKDIEIITSMKMLTMISNEIDKTLSVEDKQKIKDDIVKSIKKDFTDYKIIVVDDKTIGAYSVISYADGIIIDQLYLFNEYRNQAIGSRIVKQLISEYKNVYTWCYIDSDAINFFRKMGFITLNKKGSTVIMKYQELNVDDLAIFNELILGYKDRAGNKYLVLDDNFKEKYYLQSTDEIMNTKIGLCFDQVELARRIFNKMKYENETYCIMYSNVSFDASHTFLVYGHAGKFYWFENAWLKYRGTHEYDSMMALLKDVIEKFVKTIDKGSIDNVRLYRYEKPRAGIGYGKLINHYINSDRVRVKEIFK